MIIAVAAVYAAIAVTLYVNGSYAWSKGGSPADQFAMLGLALAIDGCKCSFLRLASLRQQEGRTLAAVLLFVLWWPCLVYSTFAGYSYLHTNRAAVSTGKQGTADERQRAQATHDQAAADLRLALANPLWAASSACTSPAKGKAKEFCDTIARVRADQADAAVILTRIAPTDANPEVTGIAANTGVAAERIQLIIALVPAILVELLASVGFYAIGKRPAGKAPGTPVEARRWFRRPKPASTRETPPAAFVEASGAMAKPVPAAVVPVPATAPTVKWKIPS
jgi:hypothetical protein